LRGVYLPGAIDVGHAFAYLPDLARTTAMLIEREGDLAAFEVFHFAGHWLARGDDLLAAIRRVTGRQDLPGRAFPWALVIALSPVMETFRELIEMRYLWRLPIGLDETRLRAFLGDVPKTPLDRAIAATLADMGVLDAPQASGVLVPA
jgi:nucleoside-diphosphate-sugar epimerase